MKICLDSVRHFSRPFNFRVKPIFQAFHLRSPRKSFFSSFKYEFSDLEEEVSEEPKTEFREVERSEGPLSREKLGIDVKQMRLDRYLKTRFPNVPDSLLQKLLRKKKIKISYDDQSTWNSGKPNMRLDQDLWIRFPSNLHSIDQSRTVKSTKEPVIDAEKRREVRSWVIHKDDHIIVINKPIGIAVQGGTDVSESLVDYLPALSFTASEPPRLVHRLDKDVSGILVLARDKLIAQRLSEMWVKREIKKLYWAVLIGSPSPRSGVVRKPLSLKQLPLGAESVQVVEDESKEKSKRCVTEYDTISTASTEVSLVALRPFTGRKHQLRVHCASVLNCPILGDYKYGSGMVSNLQEFIGLKKLDLHLHAREISFKHPGSNSIVKFSADLPQHMVHTLNLFNLMDKTTLKNSRATISAQELSLAEYRKLKDDEEKKIQDLKKLPTKKIRPQRSIDKKTKYQ